MGPSANTTTESPIRTSPDSAPLKPVEAMSARSTTCSSETLVGDGREVRLGGRHQQVLRLRAVDGVAEAPAAERLVAPAVAALAQVARQAGATLAAGRDGPDQHSIADLVASDTRAELLDDADRLVADDEARADRVLALDDVDVGAADGRGGDTDHRLAGARVGPRDLLDADVARAVEHGGAHGVGRACRGRDGMGKDRHVGLRAWRSEVRPLREGGRRSGPPGGTPTGWGIRWRHIRDRSVRACGDPVQRTRAPNGGRGGRLDPREDAPPGSRESRKVWAHTRRSLSEDDGVRGRTGPPAGLEEGVRHVTHQNECLDGNEAAARVAFALSEVISIYPITPASPMAEHCDDWAAAGRTNLWGMVPDVVEMQSEAGAAGAMHGALQKGAMATTFTASQGLLLMVPNMFKIAGELTPTVIHVAARTVATHALSIFGDHSDVMHARTTGWAMLAAGSVQEAHDFALVAHAATLRARVPFLHFFDGFRTSHEINKIAVLEPDDLRALVRDDDVLAFRGRGMTPDAPVVRGTAQNPDVFFQAREASNPFHLAVPGIVEQVMDELAVRTGRRYGLADYHGAPDAERVVIVMGSAGGAVEETVDSLMAAGERVGMVRIRLFQPFPVEQIMAALPSTVRALAVLDRTKEPGAVGEPLYLEVVAGLSEAMDGDSPPFARAPRVIGGRYGLSSKEMTPSMIKPIFEELAAVRPKRHFTVGIYDDVTHLSLPIDGGFRRERPKGEVQAVFFGLGSDGTVGANKASVKIIGESTDLFAQGYFVYDSKKSGSVTVSHLRFGPEPIRSTYLVENADFVACHQFGLLTKAKVLETANHGATFLLNAPYGPDEIWHHLPRGIQQQLVDKEIDFWVIDALAVADEVGMGSRINTVMQPCFFQLAGILPPDEAIARIKGFVEATYAKRGEAVVARNFAAIDRSLERLAHVPLHAVTNDRVTALSGARSTCPSSSLGSHRA